MQLAFGGFFYEDIYGLTTNNTKFFHKVNEGWFLTENSELYVIIRNCREDAKGQSFV
jgi:hypothetical protein